jgi:hypothetical protein
MSPLHTTKDRIVLTAGLVAVFFIQTILAQTCSNTLRPQYNSPVVGGGWSYRLIANNFSRPRGIVFDQSGALLVVDSRVGIVRLNLADDGGTCLSVKSKTTVVDSPEARCPSPESPGYELIGSYS